MSATRKLIVTRTWTIREGEKNGKPWRLSGVEATDLEGTPVAVELKTFGSLPYGEVEVEVEEQEDRGYGVSYMLKPVGGSARPRGGTEPSSELRELRSRVERLESQVAELRQVSSSSGAPTSGLPADDDVPF